MICSHIVNIDRIHQCGQENLNSRVHHSTGKKRLAEFPIRMLNPRVGMSLFTLTAMIDSFSHIPIHFAKKILIYIWSISVSV